MSTEEEPQEGVTPDPDCLWTLLQDGGIGDKCTQAIEGDKANTGWYIDWGIIELEFPCNNGRCKGHVMTFLPYSEDGIGEVDAIRVKSAAIYNVPLEFRCKHCEFEPKLFLIRVSVHHKKKLAEIEKLAEWPIRGEPLSPRLKKFAGASQHLLNKGYESELHKLGIGAFAYYRRVLENNTTDLIAEIRAVAVQRSSPQSVIDNLDKALRMVGSYTRAIEEVGKALPVELLIDGKNPLKILHKALSAGVHAKTDRECLANAVAVRELLEGILEMIDHLVKQPSKLRKAITEAEKAAQASASNIQ